VTSAVWQALRMGGLRPSAQRLKMEGVVMISVAKRQEVVALVGSGWSAQAAADRVGVSRSSAKRGHIWAAQEHEHWRANLPRRLADLTIRAS